MDENDKSIPTKRPKIKDCTNYHKNMSTEDFNMICERFETFHMTGIYLSPPEKPVACQNKNQKKRSPRSYIPEDEPENSTAYRISNLRQSRRRVEQYEARIQNIFDKHKKNTKTAANQVLPVKKEQLSDFVDELLDKFDRDLQEILLNSFNPNDPITLKNENLDQMMSDSVINIDDSINDSAIIILSSDSESDDNNENFQLMEKKSRKNSVGKMRAKSQNSSEEKNGGAAGLSLTCPVCFGILKDKEVMSTTCGHLFCTLCITNCIKVNKSCPVCRKVLTLKRIHPVYF